jgi:hypothetical protein
MAGAEMTGTDATKTKAAGKTGGAKKSAKSGTETGSRIKPKAAKLAHEGFDFVGRVESLAVRGGASLETFEFGLRGRHGLRQTFRLNTSDSFSLNIIAPIVTAAHANEAKIGVRAVADEGGVHYVTEVASRPKLGKAG